MCHDLLVCRPTGVTYQMADRAADAIKAYESALALDDVNPPASDALFNLGVALQEGGGSVGRWGGARGPGCVGGGCSTRAAVI